MRCDLLGETMILNSSITHSRPACTSTGHPHALGRLSVQQQCIQSRRNTESLRLCVLKQGVIVGRQMPPSHRLLLSAVVSGNVHDGNNNVSIVQHAAKGKGVGGKRTP